MFNGGESVKSSRLVGLFKDCFFGRLFLQYINKQICKYEYWQAKGVYSTRNKSHKSLLNSDFDFSHQEFATNIGHVSLNVFYPRIVKLQKI